MNNIRDYIALTERTYSYRIKTIAPLEDEQMTAIEKVMLKYDPLDITHPRKTLFQTNPLDFLNIEGGAEVFIVDITLGLPVSPSVLHTRLCSALRLADKFVVVIGANDPIENEIQRLAAEALIAEEAEKAGLTPEALLLDPAYKEAQEFAAGDLYGNDYNTKFLTYLKAAQDRRLAEIEPIKATPFSYLAPTEAAAEDYNDSLQTDTEAKGDNKASVYRSIQGNYDSDKKEFRRVFRTKSGSEKILTKDADGVRKAK